MHGVLAIGDSLANGNGDTVNDVQSQSYALWLAQAGDWCFKRYSVGGYTSQRVVDEQLPRVGDQRFVVVAVSVGTNDVLTDVPTAVFATNLEQILTAATTAAEHVVITTVPLSAGHRPGARDRRREVRRANDVIAQSAYEHGAAVLDIVDFHGPSQLRGDRVHPNALGQLQIATRAATALAERGLIVVDPAQFTLGRVDGRVGARAVLKYGAQTPGLATRQSVKRLLGRG